MKLLTFLGLGNYHPTTYSWQDQEYTSDYAPVASCHFLQPDSLTVFLTEEVQEKTYPQFLEALPGDFEVDPLLVPLGKNQQELWQLFECISGAVDPGDEVAFDITHGLRAFPLVSLLVAAFLRSGLNVHLRAVLYGAFDVRDESVTPNRTPMFDLTPMIGLLEWASAADRFNRTGDARYLATKVEEQRRNLAISARGDHDLLEEAGRLGNLGGALESISQSLRLIRPQRTMLQVAGLQERIDLARPALERAAAAQPFGLLLKNIAETYTAMTRLDCEGLDETKRTLAIQREMIQWYADRHQWVQAVSLGREWLVSWVMVHLGLQNLTEQSDRQRITQVVGSEAQEYLKAKDQGAPYTSVFLTTVPETEAVLLLWHQLTHARNDIDHAGMREHPQAPKNLIKQIGTCIETIYALPL